MSGWGEQMDGEPRRYVPPHVRGGTMGVGAPPPPDVFAASAAYGGGYGAPAGGYGAPRMGYGRCLGPVAGHMQFGAAALR